MTQAADYSSPLPVHYSKKFAQIVRTDADYFRGSVHIYSAQIYVGPVAVDVCYTLFERPHSF